MAMSAENVKNPPVAQSLWEMRMPIEQRWEGQSFHCQILTIPEDKSLEPAGATSCSHSLQGAALPLGITFCFGNGMKN